MMLLQLLTSGLNPAVNRQNLSDTHVDLDSQALDPMPRFKGRAINIYANIDIQDCQRTNDILKDD